MTADTYGSGTADEALAARSPGCRADSYCLVSMIGHDFYGGLRDGQKGFPRFTDPRYAAAGFRGLCADGHGKALARLRHGSFRLPDAAQSRLDRLLARCGLESDAAYAGTRSSRNCWGRAGPANGFTLDLILCMERFGALLDWAMVILSPMEPWPGRLVLPAAEKNAVKVVTRVVDHGGVFHDDVKPGIPSARAITGRSGQPAGSSWAMPKWMPCGPSRKPMV